MGLGPTPAWWLQLRPTVLGVGPAVTPRHREALSPFSLPAEKPPPRVRKVVGPSHRDQNGPARGTAGWV